jgi:tryptophan 2,3-dioxygenase
MQNDKMQNEQSDLSSPPKAETGDLDLHYHDYLQLDKILNAQSPESYKQNLHAHDEMLFIIIHQTYELWFKQLHHEADSIAAIMKKPALNDNSPELQTVVHRLNRIATILRVLVHQVDIMETMTPMDFLDFRDMLRPASGFQSWQFKELEAKLGLKFQHRHGQEYYISQLRQEHINKIKKAESEKSLLELVNSWLERMPLAPAPSNSPKGGEPSTQSSPAQNASANNLTVSWNFWSEYRTAYAKSLADEEKNNLAAFDETFFETSNLTAQTSNFNRSVSPSACRAALFIMLYRGYPLLQLPFQLLNALLEIDEQLSSWRYRHMNMVHRMIGTRIGTGGSSGKDYLKAAADKHYIFKEIAQLNSFLIERRKLPGLPKELEIRLGFVG